MTLQQAFDFSAQPPKKARRNLVIEAGAGTGKTTAIVAEVLRLMLENESLVPERIVLMTFTEKAAGEIADRIRMALEELDGAAQWPIDSPNPLLTIDPEKARPVIRRHLEQIDKLRSQTIHSFCQSLLRSFPIEAGLDPQFRIIEGFERTLLYGQLYDAWLDDETRVHPTDERIAEWELLFTHVGYLFQIRDVLFSMLERRDLLTPVIPSEVEGSGSEGGTTARPTHPDPSTAPGMTFPFGDVSEVEGALLDAIAVVRKCFDDGGEATSLFEYLRRVDPPGGGTLDQWIEYFEPVAAVILDAKLPRSAVLKGALKVFRTSDKKGRSIHERLASHRAAMAILALTRRFLAFLDEEKRKLGVVDFDDLLLRTLAVLQDPDVLARARAQFDHIFVDEFQDTDRTQAQIIDLLARDSSGDYVPGRTVVVGDPKQSIYGFRRADPETYYQMTQRLERGGAEKRVIADQYRSDAPLVDAINAIFARLFPPSLHDPNVFRPEYHALRPGKPRIARDLDARLTVLQVEAEERSERCTIEAEGIAEWILARAEGDLRRFAILFRRMTILDDYLDVFDRRGIDYVLPPTRQFLDRRAPVDLLAVLRAIAYPFDRGAQISAARTPYFGLTDDEIARGVLESPSRRVAESPSAGDPATPWSDFLASIAAFRAASHHLTVSQLIDRVVKITNIESVYDAAENGVRHLRHLEHVRSIAFEYDQMIGGSAGQFVDEIARRREEPDEAEPSLIDEGRNAIRILTVHAAKGLEFETVILPDLGFSTTNPDAMQLFAVEEPRSLVLAGRAQSISGNFRRTADGEKLKKIGTLREEAELRRLFYVAVTRAKTDVAFVCNTADVRNTGFFKCLCELLGGVPTWLTEPGREVRATDVGPIAFEKIETSSAPDRRRRRLVDPALEAELSGPVVPIEIPLPQPVATLTSAEIAARRAGSRNRAAGTLLHRVLELWDGTAPYEPLLERLAVEAAADADAVARVRQRLGTIARSAMLQRIAKAETVGRELPIRFVEKGVVTERRIDRLLRENGRELVVDYKSGVPDPNRVEKDRDQVSRYCSAIATMTGRPCAGALWYVDLERDEVVEVS